MANVKTELTDADIAAATAALDALALPLERQLIERVIDKIKAAHKRGQSVRSIARSLSAATGVRVTSGGVSSALGLKPVQRAPKRSVAPSASRASTSTSPDSTQPRPRPPVAVA